MERRTKIAGWLFAAYCITMLILLFNRELPQNDLSYAEKMKGCFSLVPFLNIKRFLLLLKSNPSWEMQRFAIINLAGNVIMFVPLGFFMPVCFPKLQKLWKTALVVLGIMTVVEVMQMLTLRGTCDIDDLILNIPGACIGYWIFHLYRKKSGFC